MTKTKPTFSFSQQVIIAYPENCEKIFISKLYGHHFETIYWIIQKPQREHYQNNSKGFILAHIYKHKYKLFVD